MRPRAAQTAQTLSGHPPLRLAVRTPEPQAGRGARAGLPRIVGYDEEPMPFVVMPNALGKLRRNERSE